MTRTIWHECDTWRLTVWGNGTSLELLRKPSKTGFFLQGDGAGDFLAEMWRMEHSSPETPFANILRSMWFDHEYCLLGETC